MTISKILIKKADQSLDVDFAALPAISQAYIIDYGLKQCLNDAHSSVTKAEYPESYQTDSFALSEKKLAGLIAGNIRATSSGLSSLEKETQRLIYNFLASQMSVSIKALKEKQSSKVWTLEQLGMAIGQACAFDFDVESRRCAQVAIDNQTQKRDITVGIDSLTLED